MMPILHSSGVMMPGQFGPINLLLFFFNFFFTLIISKIGIPSVMHTINSISASIASIIAEAANLAGIDVTTMNAMIDDTATSIENVNSQIETATDLTSDASKGIFSSLTVLKDQVKAAAEAEAKASTEAEAAAPAEAAATPAETEAAVPAEAEAAPAETEAAESTEAAPAAPAEG